MPFLKKYNGTYYIGWNERAYFDPKNPPTATQGKNKGRIPSQVKRAISENRNYTYLRRWISTKTPDKTKAEKLLRQKTTQLTVFAAKNINDMLFEDAVGLAFPALTASTAFQTNDTYILKEFRGRWGNRYLSTITAQELNGYLMEIVSKGLNITTGRRRLVVLRTIYREALNSGKYLGPNPFDNFHGPKMFAPPRIVTLDNADQRKLLKACFDPDLLALFKKHKKHWQPLHSLPAHDLKALGYPTDKKSQARILDHLRYQTDPRNLDPETLHDIVLLTLTFGPRKGEVIGVNIRRVKSGAVVKVGGLRVRHFNPKTQRLYITRTKQSRGVGARTKVTEIKVPDDIAVMLTKHCQSKGPDDFIFSFKDRTPIVDVRWPFEEAVHFAGIKIRQTWPTGEKQEMKLQFRDLRHVAANNLMDVLPIEEAAYYLGHSSTAMLQAVYYTRRKGSQLDKHSALVGGNMAKILEGGGGRE